MISRLPATEKELRNYPLTCSHQRTNRHSCGPAFHTLFQDDFRHGERNTSKEQLGKHDKSACPENGVQGLQTCRSTRSYSSSPNSVTVLCSSDRNFLCSPNTPRLFVPLVLLHMLFSAMKAFSLLPRPGEILSTLRKSAQ